MAAGSRRVILHADMDAFYASVEQRDRPELRGLPVVVGGRPPRGVVAAASYEARPFGVRSAMPTAAALQLCPDLIVLPGDMARYVRESQRIRTIFDEISPDVEPISLDEAFIEVTSSLRALAAPPREVARKLKDRVLTETGLKVSVGIGPTKMVAKIASDLSKPDGLLVVEPEQVREFLAPLPLARLWGVGPVRTRELAKRGLTTIGQLAALDEASLDAGLADLKRLALGDDERAVESHRLAKSYGEECTFPVDLSDLEKICDVVGQHAEAVARRLRHDGVCATVVRLKVKSTERLAEPGRYRSYTRQVQLRAPSDDGMALATAARAMLGRGDLPLPLRLVGVTAAGIVPRTASIGEQMDLFARRPIGALNRAMDEITRRFGMGAVRRGAGQADKAAPSLGIKRGE